jgi:Cu+-exporting ATPase
VIAVAGVSQRDLIQMAATLEQGSEHPLAKAVMEYAANTGVRPHAVSGFTAVAGSGIIACIDRVEHTLGSPRFLVERGAVVDEALIGGLQEEGKTVVGISALMGNSPQTIGYLAIADRLRPTSRQAVRQIQEMGIEVVMLTGDHPATAAAVARQAGIPVYYAGVLPQDKAAQVKATKAAGKIVGMVGDGINDAPALAMADVSFAIGAGSDVAIEAADIALMRNDLMSVAAAISLSRATLRKIRQNLFFAFIYNVLGIPLAAMGLLNPVIAGAAMAMSSVSVVTNSLLLKRWKAGNMGMAGVV